MSCQRRNFSTYLKPPKLRLHDTRRNGLMAFHVFLVSDTLLILRSRSQVIKVFVYIYFFVGVAEVGFYYLAVKLNRAMKLLRRVFYLCFFIMTGASTFVLLTIMIFILLGMLIQPLKLAPYGMALIGTIACAVALYAKLDRYETFSPAGLLVKCDLRYTRFWH